MVCESYYQQASYSRPSPPNLNLQINPDSLTHEQVITVVASLAEEAGSIVALSFFNWATGFAKFRHFMRLYIVCATSFIGNGNLDRAREVMQHMVRSFAEIGRLKEAVNMVIEMQNHGLVLNARTLNFVIEAANALGLLDYAGDMFDEMRDRGVYPDSTSYKLMVLAHCRMGRIPDADRWLKEMLETGFVVDNATCTLIISTFCDKGLVNRVFWYFNMWMKMGLKPNLINFTSLINGMCKRGSIKQAFETLEEMVRKGWK